jgi:hypothetical protein
MNAQKNTKIVAQKPFCKVCHDAGKSESEYTSHFVRSDLGPKGKVVCPTLLSLECRYCFEKGHTVSFCAVLKKQKNADKKTVARIEFAESSVQSPLKAPKKATNSFGALDQDSDEEVSKKAKKQTKAKEEFPVLCGVVKKADNQTSGAISYAAKAAKALDMPVLSRQTHYKEKPVVVKEKKRWADWTDSEDDEDDEDDEEEVESAW